MGPEWLVRAISDAWPTEPPGSLEPVAGASQCSYELIRAFASYARLRRIRYALGAGTLLGAMRNRPPGLLQWEHDVDVYVPARDAWRLLHALRVDCAAARRPRVRWCDVLDAPGATSRGARHCCGFGFKLFHRRSSACELDVLVLAAADAPYIHGETPLWPLWAPLLARPYRRLAAAWQRLGAPSGAATGPHFVIPHDIWRGALMSDEARWCAHDSGEWAWCGTPVSFFQDEYFAPGELLPLRWGSLHGLRVRLPADPWALLNRTYGEDVGYIARLNEHAGARADLRLPHHQRLLAPAPVQRLPWWRTTRLVRHRHGISPGRRDAA
jgi:hypothetical protein